MPLQKMFSPWMEWVSSYSAGPRFHQTHLGLGKQEQKSGPEALGAVKSQTTQTNVWESDRAPRPIVLWEAREQMNDPPPDLVRSPWTPTAG